MITFTVGKYGSKANIELENEEWNGTYVIHEITAQEGLDAIDQLIANNVKYQENPESLTVTEYKAALMSKAITFNGEPFELPPTGINGIPQKLWGFLNVAYNKLNSVSDQEARFLLNAFSSKTPQSTPQSNLKSKSTSST